MSSAQGILLIGGLSHLFISMIAAYFLYWARVRDPEKPIPRYALITHKVCLWNGFLLISLFVAIAYTIYTPMINTLLAVLILVSTLLSDFTNIRRWIFGVEDQFREGPEWQARAVGLIHILDLVVVSAILVGATRTVLGL